MPRASTAPTTWAFEDPVTGPMTYKRALIGARVLGSQADAVGRARAGRSA